MGDYSHLYIGENELYNWRYELPPKDHPILSFIFDESDKKIVNVSNKLHEYRYFEDRASRKFTCRYDISVQIAMERLDRYGFTIQGITNIISNLTGIPIKNVPLALRNFVGFSTRLLEMKENMTGEERQVIEKMEEIEINYEKYAEIISETELGWLPELFVLRNLLERSQPTDKVVLDMSWIIGYGKKDKAITDCKNISLFSEDAHSKISLRRRYLYQSLVDFSSKQIDLVYIDLIIALEASIKTYLSSSKGNKYDEVAGLDIDNFLKNVSLVNATIFVIKYLKKKDISIEQKKRLIDIYNIRNNVVHGGRKNFDLTRVFHDIQLTIEIISSIENGHHRKTNSAR